MQVQGANVQKVGDIMRHHWRGLHILTLTQLTDLPFVLSDKSLHLRAWEARVNNESEPKSFPIVLDS